MKFFWLACTAVSALMLGFAELQELPTKLIYNGSGSAPLGFHWIGNSYPGRGDYVLTNIPARFENLMVNRGHLPRDVPLLKRIVAVGGDVICRRDHEVLLNGAPIAMAKPTDRSGRTLPIWQGCRRLKPDELFLLQDHPDSFDGRYFGPVNRSLIIGKATRLRFNS